MQTLLVFMNFAGGYSWFLTLRVCISSPRQQMPRAGFGARAPRGNVRAARPAAPANLGTHAPQWGLRIARPVAPRCLEMQHLQTSRDISQRRDPQFFSNNYSLI